MANGFVATLIQEHKCVLACFQGFYYKKSKKEITNDIRASINLLSKLPTFKYKFKKYQSE